MLQDIELINVTDSDEKLLRRAAEILLKDIGKVEGIEINLLNPENISNIVVEELIQQILKIFWITYVLTEMGNIKKVLSIPQDIIALQSNGRKTIPKQEELEISMKSAIRSKEFIKYWNNLCHCSSYDTVLQIDTSWSMGIMNKVRDVLRYHQTYNQIYLRKQFLIMVTMVKRMLLCMSQIQCCISTHKAVFRMWIGLLQCHIKTGKDQLIFLLRELRS